MIYTYASLGAVWLLLLLAVVLSGTGSLSGLGLLALVSAALVGPAVILRTQRRRPPAGQAHSTSAA